MSNANRHRRNSRWFHTVMLRLIDLGALNCRALYKSAGKEYSMVNMKRILAYGLAARCVRPNRVKLHKNETLFGEIPVDVQGPDERLNGKYHQPGVLGNKRKSCAVHKTVRCVTNKVCLTCGAVALCSPLSFYRYHNLINYKL